MINVELARGSGKGRIDDFDYTHQLNVMGVREYFEKMFLEEAKDAQRALYYVGRENKLKD